MNATAKRWIFPVTATDGWGHDFKDVLVALLYCWWAGLYDMAGACGHQGRWFSMLHAPALPAFKYVTSFFSKLKFASHTICTHIHGSQY